MPDGLVPNDQCNDENASSPSTAPAATSAQAYSLGPQRMHSDSNDEDIFKLYVGPEFPVELEGEMASVHEPLKQELRDAMNEWVEI